jgi:hypothetical protein
MFSEGIELAQVAADHERDHGPPIRAWWKLTGHLAFTKDNHAICDLAYLVYAMRDVDDGPSITNQPPNCVKQAVDLSRCEGCGRFIQDHQFCLVYKRSADFNQLLFGNGQGSNPARQRDLESKRLECGLEHRFLRTISQKAEAGPLASQEDVLEHAQLGDYRQLLVTQPDAEVVRVPSILDDCLGTLQADGPRVRLMNPGKDSDESALSSAVFAHDGDAL